MGLRSTEFFENTSYENDDTQIIVCNECSSHLCLSSLVLSDQFWGSSGDAYLVDKLINVSRDSQDLETSMKTGVYVINKIKCSQCYTKMGWYYKKAYNYSEYYKEGKYVIEKKFIRSISNNRTTALLTEQAKVSRRRRSSASTSSSIMDDEHSLSPPRKPSIDDYDFATAIRRKTGRRGSSVFSFREGISHALSRSRLEGIDKHDVAERDEDSVLFDS